MERKPPNDAADNPTSEWEGGDPPCWAHLFEDEPAPAAPSREPSEASDDTPR
jgi:hypothetical protein